MHPSRFCYLLLTCLLVAACSRPQGVVELSGLTMGTTYSVKFTKPAVEIDINLLKNRIDRRLEEINAIMSTYMPDSELSKINRAAAHQWLPVSAELYRVIQQAQAISAASHGAFDITVGPLVNLWGFGPPGNPQKIPDADTIQSALANTGYRKIQLRDSPRAIRKELTSVYIDLSGIAKGYAVDAVAALLEQESLHDYMVEIGGEIRARGLNADREYWRIGIEKPITGERAVERIIHLRNTGMATSGNYRNFYEMDGTRYTHIIDPVTGNPVVQRLASVTVLDQACMIADAWATALFVLGPDQGMELARHLRMPVLFIIKNDTGFTETVTEEIRPALVEEE